MWEKPTPLHRWLFLRTSPPASIVLHLVSAGKTGHLRFQTVVTRIPPILPAVLAFFTRRRDLSPLALIPTSLELAYSQECSKSVTHGFQSWLIKPEAISTWQLESLRLIKKHDLTEAPVLRRCSGHAQVFRLKVPLTAAAATSTGKPAEDSRSRPLCTPS